MLACAVVAAAATFLSEHYGAPQMLFALLLGLAMNFLSGDGPCAPGIEFTARQVLRIGVALLGLRITFGQIAELGWQPAVIVVVSVVLTIGVSMLAARLMGFQTLFGLLSGGATAICGASAALALAAALPAHPLKERATLFTVVGVSALSTVAMIVYPMLAHAFGLDPALAGIFLGATIHDVAQVVGAGYSMSQETGDVATLVKLMRVAMLVPVIVFAVMLDALAHRAADGTRAPREAAAAPAVVRGRLRGAGGDQQHRLAARRRGQGRQRGLALVPGGGDRRHRHEDAIEGAGRRRPEAGAADARRDRLPGGAGAGAAALAGVRKLLAPATRRGEVAMNAISAGPDPRTGPSRQTSRPGGPDDRRPSRRRPSLSRSPGTRVSTCSA